MKKLFILFLILISMPCFAWDILRSKKGSLTGYSTPISQDIFKQLNINPDDKMQNLKSPNVMTDLFSAPQLNYDYDSNGRLKETRAGGLGAKTGVTIIYD